MRNILDLELALAAVTARLEGHDREIRRIDGLVASRLDEGRRTTEAAIVAEQCGIRPALSGLTAADRKTLARELRSRGWTYQQIQHVLGCSHMAIARYMRGGT